MNNPNEKTPIKRQTNVRNTENHTYTCEYCKIEYIPKRRRAQKYCCNSCRSKAYRLRQLAQLETQPIIEPTKIGIEKMSPAGVGNAFLGTAALEAAKLIFTNEENKTATKGDLKNLENKIGKFHRIKKIPKMLPNTIPYYNMETKEVEFFMREFLPIG